MVIKQTVFFLTLLPRDLNRCKEHIVDYRGLGEDFYLTTVIQIYTLQVSWYLRS